MCRCHRQDYEEETEKLKKFTQQTTEKYRKKKTRKIRSFLDNREVLKKKKRKRRRKKKHCVDNNKEQQRTRNQNTVLNISNVPLSSDERDLLSRGLSFCPRPSQINRFQLEEDTRQFFRRIRLKEFFYNEEEVENDNENIRPFKDGPCPAIEILP